MWQTDTVSLQTATEVNTNGSIKRTWTKSTDVLCDVQDISKEYVVKEYGYTDATEYKQIFDHTLATWTKGSQVEFEGSQWLVRNVNDTLNKIGNSNHNYIIISKVIGEYNEISIYVTSDDYIYTTSDDYIYMLEEV